MADVANVVARLNRLHSRAPRNDAFWASAEAGEEVRLDETSDDTEVGLDDAAVERGGRAVVHLAHDHEFDVVLAIVVDDFVVSDDLGGEHVFELGPTVGTMRAGLVDENDPITRMVTKSFEQPRDDAFVGSGARVVRKRDHHTIGLTKTLPEWRVTDGMRKRMKKGSILIGERDAFSWFDDRSLMIGALDLVQATTKGERDAHGFSQFRGINSPMQKAFRDILSIFTRRMSRNRQHSCHTQAMHNAIRRELRVAFSKKAQPPLFRVIKWFVQEALKHGLGRPLTEKRKVGATICTLTVVTPLRYNAAWPAS